MGRCSKRRAGCRLPAQYLIDSEDGAGTAQFEPAVPSQTVGGQGWHSKPLGQRLSDTQRVRIR